MSGRITLSTTDEAEALYEQLENDIENLYGGKSAFWRSMLMNFDEKGRIEAKIEMINQRIENHENKIKDLKLQKKGLKQELDEITVEEQEELGDEDTDVEEEFWDKTMKKIFERTSSEDLETVQKRWDKWFNGRHKLFVNKYYQVTTSEFKQMVLEKAEERGYEEKVEKL